MVTDGDLNAVPAELRGEVVALQLPSCSISKSVGCAIMQTTVQLSVTHGFWLVQVREKLLELYKTVASVMPAASKERCERMGPDCKPF